MKIREKQIDVQDSFNMGSNLVQNVLDPISAQDAATKAYVDAVVQGLNPKDSVKYSTVSGENIDLSTGGLSGITIDGATPSLTTDDRILVKNQTLPAQNGIYLAKAGTWVRALDANTWTELVAAFTFVEQGTTMADTGWVCTADQGGTLETTAVAFTQFSAAGSYTTDGEGIEVTASVFSLELDGDSLSKSASGLKSATHLEEQFSSLTPTASPTVDHDTGVAITNTPAGDCDVTVQVNGVTETVSYGAKTGSFWFEPSGGGAARAQVDIIATDEVWFSPSNAGYDLESTDTIVLIYSHIN